MRTICSLSTSLLFFTLTAAPLTATPAITAAAAIARARSGGAATPDIRAASHTANGQSAMSQSSRGVNRLPMVAKTCPV